MTRFYAHFFTTIIRLSRKYRAGWHVRKLRREVL